MRGARGIGAGIFSGRDADMEQSQSKTGGSTSHADRSIHKRVTRSRCADKKRETSDTQALRRVECALGTKADQQRPRVKMGVKLIVTAMECHGGRLLEYHEDCTRKARTSNVA